MSTHHRFSENDVNAWLRQQADMNAEQQDFVKKMAMHTIRQAKQPRMVERTLVDGNAGSMAAGAHGAGQCDEDDNMGAQTSDDCSGLAMSIAGSTPGANLSDEDANMEPSQTGARHGLPSSDGEASHSSNADAGQCNMDAAMQEIGKREKNSATSRHEIGGNT